MPVYWGLARKYGKPLHCLFFPPTGPADDIPAHNPLPFLTDQNRQLRQLLRQSPALIATLEGPEHRFTFTNPGDDALVEDRARLGHALAGCMPEAESLGFVDLLDAGTGLGLYMVRRYVELMRGQLDFTSPLEQGSVFPVCLPLHAPTL
ncbi:sensor histidine kinase [Hymenobacter algoricola]|uniref:sensor histidine kinase n=1 Tax=Hymenobacter algoricola TaxID=486267 RepID=UPI0031ED7395